MQQRSSSTRRRVNGENEKDEFKNRQPSVTSPIDINNGSERRRRGASARSGAEAFKSDIDAHSNRLTKTDGDGVFEGCALPSSQSLNTFPKNNRRFPEKDIVTERDRLGQSKPKQSGKELKLTRRVVAAVIMFLSFVSMLYAGHEVIACFIILLQFRLFHELVTVGYAEMKQYARRNNREIPLFRTMQWAWFLVALMFSYGLDIFKAPMTTVDKLMPSSAFGLNDGSLIKVYIRQCIGVLQKYYEINTFILYVVTFCATILLLRKDRYRYQIRVLSFTFLVLALIVLQLKVAIYNVFSGLVWFLLPVMLVITNDTFAYICGKTFGKKILKNWEFLRLSPNKTWEGYIGAAIFTMIMGWYLPKILGHVWLTCSFRELEAMSGSYKISDSESEIDVYNKSMPDVSSPTCKLEYLFEPSTCNLSFGPHPMTCMPAQVHGLVLSMFASIVAPFGGFFASAIKRAYNIKDFESVIPGHGGAMDRLDCQFIMALATYVYCHTFLNGKTDAVNDVIDSIRGLSEEELREVYKQMNMMLQKG